MENLTRRDFMGTMGAAGAVAALAGIAGGSPAEVQAEAAAPEPNITSPERLFELGGSSMSLYDLNKQRHEIVDEKGDFTCPDGTVIPAVWNKLRALTNSYGVGCGSDLTEATKESFDFFKMLFNEDEAQAYIEMPYGVYFTAAEFAQESGRDEAECLDICEKLASKCLLYRCRRAGVPYFHHLALVHGFFEYALRDFYNEGWVDNFNTIRTPDYVDGYVNSGTAFYYPIPCDASVVADEEGVLPLEDYEAIIDRNSVFAVSPCQCRLYGMAARGDEEPPAIGTEELKDFMVPNCGHPLETCLTIGEEAEFYIENGIGRQIDADEARAILRRSVDAGMILQSAFAKDACVICSCHGDCCRILGCYQAIGAEGCAEATSFPNNSHYDLAYDKDACLQCGACVERCPMFAISMDEDGYPVVDARCMRCGQCGMVCPVEARKLTAKAPEDRIELPANMMDDYNLKAAYRIERGSLY